MSKPSKKFFVTGIDTNIGKTIISAILTEALQADYWKPIQSGDLTYSDTDKVKELISNPKTNFHQNTYSLKTPASPHYSAMLDGIKIDLSNFSLPKTNKNLIVEGAGGLMVPLNEKHLLIDLIKALNLELILVIKNYLGSINHSLLSIEVLKAAKIPVRGIIFNGKMNASSEDYILAYTKVPLLGRVQEMENVTPKEILKYAKQFEFLGND